MSILSLRLYVFVLGSVQELEVSEYFLLVDVDSSIVVPAESLRVLHYEKSEHSIKSLRIFASQQTLLRLKHLLFKPYHL